MRSKPAPSLATVPPLGPGARVAVVATSSPFDAQELARGVARLRSRYDVQMDDDLHARRGYLAGDDARRLRELRAALADPSVRAIVAARGGYGATRLLAELDPAQVAAAPKLLVGFSDVTALHALWARAGLRSLHGPMAAALGRDDGEALSALVLAAEGALPDPFVGLRSLAGGRASGRLVGGNLAVLAALVGTGYEPPVAGCVLLLEDVGERPYRVDRMLTTLRHAGWLGRVAAVACGAFVECEPGSDGTTVEEVLADRLGDLGVPVVGGVPVGHAGDNVPLPLGALATVDADRGVLTIEEPAVG